MHPRTKFLLGGAVVLGAAGVLMAGAIKDTGIYFLMPAELEGMSEDEAAKFRAVMGEVTARMMPRMFEAMAPIYADIFTLEELQALVDFYQSDVGRSMVTKSYQAAPRLAEAVQAIMPEIMAEMGNVLCDEFECTAEQRRELKAAMSQAVGR